MIIQPKIRGFICTTAHPEGCYQHVAQQINFVKTQSIIKGVQRVLVIGASTGYGLSSRIIATFASHAQTIGVAFEKPADAKRTASAGWYNTAAFERQAHAAGYYAKSIIGDAFSNAIKQKVADLIRKDWGQVDLIIYSLAAPRRIHPQTGQIFNSVLKPIGKPFSGKTVDAFKNEVKEVLIEPATQEEIDQTIAVMGGEDWELWLDFLGQENLLANNIKTVAYSYLGPQLTHSIYKDGTIGKAKEHLKITADKLQNKLKNLPGQAFIAVNKAVVTQASSAIPVVPLYISLLFKYMKANGTHEGCIEQMYRLFNDYLYAANHLALDNEGYIRLDDKEMDPTVQQLIMDAWPRVTTANLAELTDIAGYRHDFYQLFGFDIKHVNYQVDIEPIMTIPSIK